MRLPGQIHLTYWRIPKAQRRRFFEWLHMDAANARGRCLVVFGHSFGFIAPRRSASLAAAGPHLSAELARPTDTADRRQTRLETFND